MKGLQHKTAWQISTGHNYLFWITLLLESLFHGRFLIFRFPKPNERLLFRCIQRTIRASECCHHCSALLLSAPLISTQGVLTMGATALEGSEIRHKLKNQCFTSDVTLLIKVCMCIVRMARAEQHLRLCYLMNDPNMNSSWVWAEPGWGGVAGGGRSAARRRRCGAR